MMMEAAEGRRGRQAQYHVVDAPTAIDSSLHSSNINDEDRSSSTDIDVVVDDADVDDCYISNSNHHHLNGTEMEESAESASRGSTRIPLRPTAHLSHFHSPLCFRILIAIIIALFLDIIVLSAYIYTHPQGANDERDASTTMATSSESNDNDNNLPELGTLAWKALPPSDAILTKVAFGSCMSQKMPQPHWDTLTSNNNNTPDLLLLMGDNVYGDCDEDDPTSCQALHQAYVDFENHVSVQGAAPRLAVLATLDDHDYGQGDCHANNPYKDLAKSWFQKVFHIAHDDLPNDGTDGVYRSKTFGPPGQRLQVILLDTRYGRGPFLPVSEDNPTVYAPPPPYPADDDFQQTMLSENQWTWLREQLLNEPQVDLRLIVSSIQVLNDVTGYECWRHLPKERHRFYDLLRQAQEIMMLQNNNSTTNSSHNSANDDSSNPEGEKSPPRLAPILLLSGDRHVGGFYSTNHGDDNGAHLYEVTASSWTHSFPLELHNDTCSHTPTLCEEADPRRVGKLHHENNFGSLHIDWQQRIYTVALQKTDSTYGITYSQPDVYGDKGSDAGSVLVSHSFRF